ncbi:MAG TPA: helix-turn-helix domain-containing protein [Gammaproteobacteria bacterium]|nr:helix-turn-helix domain-containing protein [Gammaproteobacteria bacterium]MDP7153697.1 helix-turn-helix domain-containing protein [Gammaproteobacteria bacterium]MDP7297052.1 helix-turn-helix domain-containing protein [Gammaproteobacteria bacterium]MDP7660690.1 helix-turn-helix domain-containing protein [Gammaproteobacteria bacterium]HJP39046.1 helix-turn-helix domain-containing protein [Gammaproteobacteria bacterium]
MTQVSDATGESTIQDRPPGPGLGEKLRIGREKKSLSIERVAEVLHLDETIIIALEQENFAALGAPVYIRGHLKAYAQLLSLSPVAITSEYQEFYSSEPVAVQALWQPKVVSVSISPVLWVGVVLVILLGLLLGIYVLFAGEDLSDTVSVNSGADVPKADQPVPIVSVMDDVGKAAGGVSMPALPALDGAEANAIGAQQVELPAPAAVVAMQLVLQFNQESWVEISDANQRLLFGLQRQGYRREVSGEPPFNLLIGNAQGVDLIVNGKPFAVPVSGVTGKVARFMITGEDHE